MCTIKSWILLYLNKAVIQKKVVKQNQKKKKKTTGDQSHLSLSLVSACLLLKDPLSTGRILGIRGRPTRFQPSARIFKEQWQKFALIPLHWGSLYITPPRPESFIRSFVHSFVHSTLLLCLARQPCTGDIKTSPCAGGARYLVRNTEESYIMYNQVPRVMKEMYPACTQKGLRCITVKHKIQRRKHIT